MDEFILSTDRVQTIYLNRMYYIPKHILLISNNKVQLYNIITNIKQNSTIMSGAFSIIIVYGFLDNLIVMKVMSGDNKKIQNELEFYNIIKTKKNYDKHICKFYGSVQENYKGINYNYLFLEKLETDLYDYLYIHNCKLVSFEFCKEMLINICKNLIFIHESGFVYNDLKLENIMVDSKGNIKLIDFNCVSCSNLKWIGSGTLEYMSPEAITNIKNNNDNLIIDKKSDSWSFGLIIYELFTKKQSPFYSKNKTNIIKKVLKNKYNDGVKAEELFKTNNLTYSKIHRLDENIATIFSSCLKTNYQHRPSLQEILYDLYKLK